MSCQVPDALLRTATELCQVRLNRTEMFGFLARLVQRFAHVFLCADVMGRMDIPKFKRTGRPCTCRRVCPVGFDTKFGRSWTGKTDRTIAIA
jgi:hypothetical protein